MIGRYSQTPRCSVPKLLVRYPSARGVSTSVNLTSARAVAARVPEVVEKLTIRILSPLKAYKPEFCALSTRVGDSQRHIRMVSCAERLRNRLERSGVALD